MDTTPLEHAVIAVLITLIGLELGMLDVGAAIAITAFIVREGEQALVRWANIYGGGRRANTPWWAWADYRVWDLGSLLDWIVPTVAVIILLMYMLH